MLRAIQASNQMKIAREVQKELNDSLREKQVAVGSRG
jgi:hypothetical protein